MHRLNQMNQISTKHVRRLAATFLGGIAVCLMASIAPAQPPHVAQADLDYEGSGFLLPEGASSFNPGLVQRAMLNQTQAQPAVAQVGFFDKGCDAAACDAVGCDAPGMGIMMAPASTGYGGPSCGGQGCGSTGCGSCNARGGFLQRRMAARQARRMQPCEPILSGGLLGKLHGGCGTCGGGGCSSCGGMGGEQLSGLRHICLFCRGNGCSACQLFNPAAFVGAWTYLKPYTEGGLCNQRWYDVSVGALFLGRTTQGIGSGVVTQRGAGGFGTPVLFGGDGSSGDLEAGIRLSGAIILGPGGNVELTYMGGQEWSDSASVSSPVTLASNPDTATNVAFPFVIASGADLYSFISDFGTDPIGGFDDTDRSISQTIESSAHFHSGEVNYRRRTVGPYCRFQGSWLMGLRYLRYDESVGLGMVGLNNDGVDATLTDGTLRFFNANNRIKNDLFGVQVGGDLWWNVMPGISFGLDGKVAWMKNEVHGNLDVSANSIVSGGPGTVSQTLRGEDGTLAGEFQVKMLYRLSRSWSYRMAYYLMAVDEVGTAGFDAQTINSALPSGSLSDPGIKYNSLVLNGFSVGAEYTW